MWPSNNGPQYTRPGRNEDILKRQVRSSLCYQTIVAMVSKELEFPPMVPERQEASLLEGDFTVLTTFQIALPESLEPDNDGSRKGRTTP